MEKNMEILIVTHKSFMNGRLFTLDERQRGYETKKPWLDLMKELGNKGYILKTIDQSEDINKAHAIVFIEMPKGNNPYYMHCIANRLFDKMYLIVNEPKAVLPPNHNPSFHSNFKRILTWNDELVDGHKYLKFFYMLPIRYGKKVILPRFPFSNKKLLCLISSNKHSSYDKELYSERIRAIRFMEKFHPKEFDLYGFWWDLPIINNGFLNDLLINAAISKFWPKLPSFLRFKRYPSYRGTIDYKKDILPKYKFTISYENEFGAKGYTSEKILEAMLHGCVPVYLGDPDITKHIPKNCFIDKREYPTYESLYKKLSSIDENEHFTYLNNIEKFLNSENVYPFTIDSFIESFKNLFGIK